MKPSDQQLLKASGETMYGLDRKAGGKLAKYTEWNKFWYLVDLAGASTKWPHYFMGGPLAPLLKNLCGKIMFQWFTELHNKYINQGSDAAIAGDDRLAIHFCYGCWNGEGWFAKFSKALNNAVAKFPNQKEIIFQEAIKARTQASNLLGIPNKAIRQQGAKMLQLFKKMGL